MGYSEFIRSKIRLDHRSGFVVPVEELSPVLKPHQRDICAWALEGGRRAIFAAFGLGKTVMQIEVPSLGHPTTSITWRCQATRR